MKRLIYFLFSPLMYIHPTSIQNYKKLKARIERDEFDLFTPIASDGTSGRKTWDSWNIFQKIKNANIAAAMWNEFEFEIFHKDYVRTVDTYMSAWFGEKNVNRWLNELYGKRNVDTYRNEQSNFMKELQTSYNKFIEAAKN